MPADHPSLPGAHSGSTGVLEQAGEDARRVEAGLDALDTAPLLPPTRTALQVFVRSVLPPILFLALLVFAWQIAYWLELKESYALPRPGEVAASSATSSPMGAPGRR